MKKYCITFETENRVAVTCIRHLIENTFGDKVEVNEVQEKKEQKLCILPSLDFVVYHESIPRPFAVNYNGLTKTLTKNDFTKYCILILEKFDTNNVCEQYNILKRCGIPDESLFLLFSNMSVSDIESLINGHPYPYVAQQWGRIFSRVPMEVEQKVKNEEIKRKFDLAEQNDFGKLKKLNYIFDVNKHKRHYVPISESERKLHSHIKTFKQFADYLYENRITNDAFYKKYGISFQIIGNIRRGIFPSDEMVRKINLAFGSNIDPSIKDKVTIYKSSKKPLFDGTIICIKTDSNPIRQLIDMGFKQCDISRIFGVNKSIISRYKNNKDFRFREKTMKNIEKLGKIKFVD